MKHIEHKNLTLVSEEDLDNSELYRIQSLKERLGAVTEGYNKDTATALEYYGIIKEPTDMKFSVSVPTSSSTFTILAGNAVTKFKTSSNLETSPMYEGGEFIRISANQTISHRYTSLNDENYVFACYVELHKRQKYDEAGINFELVDRHDAWILVQMTAAQATTFYSTDSILINGIDASYLDSVSFTNVEKNATFNTIDLTNISFTLTKYNSIFLGRTVITGVSPIQYTPYLAGGSWTRPEFSTVDQYHRNLHTAHGTVSDIVGLTDSQILTNKTLTNPRVDLPKINENVNLTVTSTKLNYATDVTSNIQAQINSVQGQIDTDVTNLITHINNTTTAHGATSANTANKIVQRDASGNFSAGTIAANLNGNANTATIAGSCSGNSATATIAGSCSGNSATVTNGVYTTDINYIDLTDGGITNIHSHTALTPYSNTILDYIGNGIDDYTSGIFTVPANIFGNSAIVEEWGGGGDGWSGMSGGGGGGGYCRKTITVSPGQQFNYSVGRGARERANGGSPEGGRASSFGGILTATGGAGASGNTGGAGGTGTGGDVNYAGGQGGGMAGNVSGGGGGAGGGGLGGITVSWQGTPYGTDGVLGTGSVFSTSLAGNGANGVGFDGHATGSTPGGGGSGNAGNGNQVVGGGGHGRIIIWYYI